MRKLGTCIALVVLVVVGACGDAESGRGTGRGPSSPPTTVATTAPVPAPLAPDQAALRYLAIVAPYNLALEGLEQVINGGQPVEVLRAQADATATASATQIEQLRAEVWPPEVQPSIDELVAESELAQPFWLQAAQAETSRGVIDATVAASEHDGSAPAATIRSLLQLDQYDEGEYTP